MPKKYKSCISNVKRKIKSGKIPKTYMSGGKRRKTSPYAICASVQRDKYKKLKSTDKEGHVLYKGKRGGKFYIRQGEKVYVK